MTDPIYISHSETTYNELLWPFEAWPIARRGRRQKNIDRIAFEAERKQRFAKGGKWV
ncbi:hypothetical protein M0R72_20115 [Candidatus Pacearchaeota archaeon]|jgi:hypothetical protein|nr:hypothetical protein [Candidatus Pacearchaeota archaeon]